VQKIVGYQILSGLWNPREQAYSWIVARDYPATKPGRQEGGFFLDCYLLGVEPDEPLLSRTKITQQAKEARTSYVGPPIALAVVTTEIIETVRGDEPEAQPQKEEEHVEECA
jgi:hypothetical protein